MKYETLLTDLADRVEVGRAGLPGWERLSKVDPASVVLARQVWLQCGALVLVDVGPS